MMSIAKLVSTAALIATLTACGTAPDANNAPVNPPITTPSPSPQPIISDMQSLVNDVRAQNDLPALKRSTKLNAAARRHGDDMAQNEFFSHTSSNGDTLSDRLADQQYGACYGAENLAWGQASESAAFSGWMGSDGHRANILSAEVAEFGFTRRSNTDGKMHPFWIMVFGTPGC